MTTWEQLQYEFDKLNSGHDCHLSPDDGCDVCELVANFYEAKQKYEKSLVFWEEKLLKNK